MACYGLLSGPKSRRGGAYCKLNSTSFFGVSAANGLLLVVSVGWLRRGGAYCKLKYVSFFADFLVFSLFLLKLWINLYFYVFSLFLLFIDEFDEL